MIKGINAGELVKKAGGGKGAELAKNGVKRVADHKAVDRAFKKGIDKSADRVIAAAFAFATGGASAAIQRKRDKWKERRDAADLARQVDGTFSLNVIIGSERYHVVWLADETPLPRHSRVAEGRRTVARVA